MTAGQSHKHSAMEIGANYVTGFGLSWIVYAVAAMPMQRWMMAHGFHATWVSFWVTVLFTIVSVCRSYFWRRLFNRIHVRSRA